MLDFFDLKDTYSEKDLESATVAELQRFRVELGTDFAFLAREKRIAIDNRGYFLAATALLTFSAPLPA